MREIAAKIGHGVIVTFWLFMVSLLSVSFAALLAASSINGGIQWW